MPTITPEQESNKITLSKFNSVEELRDFKWLAILFGLPCTLTQAGKEVPKDTKIDQDQLSAMGITIAEKNDVKSDDDPNGPRTMTDILKFLLYFSPHQVTLDSSRLEVKNDENLESLLITFTNLPRVPETFPKQAQNTYNTEIIYPLEQEKARLEEKRKALREKIESNPETQASERSYIQRIVAFSEAIAKTRVIISSPSTNYNDEIDNPIQGLLKNPALVKYKDQKWLRGAANAFLLLMTLIVPGLIKYVKTGSLFLSMEGDSKNVARKLVKTKEKLLQEEKSGDSKLDSKRSRRSAGLYAEQLRKKEAAERAAQKAASKPDAGKKEKKEL